ncbi:MAG: phosphocholine cytidylyltransferase family protein [Rhodospirillales bacterium]|jgi:choline kinase|nr:phosphocholine cytidylyltransferase family protein [Rhodospirillales bacterium]|tara:strand:- start:2420 stop:3190 length:771 start_codon:yes stop_codon:yes gene_type:complete
MKALMLAAGAGGRLSNGDNSYPPKSLLRFGGQSLIARHLDQLSEAGIEDLTLVVGYRSDDIEREVGNFGAPGRVSFIHNPDFRGGSCISLWCARRILVSGDDVLLMDADVLYHTELLRRLIGAPIGNCFAFDAKVDDDEEPVKLCLRGGHPVEFRKLISGQFEQVGEWPGFLKLSPDCAAGLADKLDEFIDSGQTGQPYEEAIRKVMMEAPPGTFGIADISDIPWIEIDFDEDLRRASEEILPAIKAFEPAENSGH